MRLRRYKPVAKGPAPLQLQAAYAVCRSISRSAARNFYYAFLALPREKRDAICAVYAFMRHADDLSDDPGLAPPERQRKLDDWLQGLHKAVAGESTDEPVLLALADAQRRYNIPLDWLNKLVAGTAMDVAPATSPTTSAPRPGGNSATGELFAQGSSASATVMENGGEQREIPVFRQYETFADLYNYCYHVASVVGLVCIRIFGYHNSAAERLAEHTGVAFQLTNIIRDVKEDAALGRVYLPAEDLARFGLNANDVMTGNVERLRPVLELQAQRARDFYADSDRLLPFINEDARPALWVLVTIYRRLLEKISASQYDVFGDKVRLSFWQKLSVFAQGMWQRIA